jgi:hypothetical protein
MKTKGRGKGRGRGEGKGKEAGKGLETSRPDPMHIHIHNKYPLSEPFLVDQDPEKIVWPMSLVGSSNDLL